MAPSFRFLDLPAELRLNIYTRYTYLSTPTPQIAANRCYACGTSIPPLSPPFPGFTPFHSNLIQSDGIYSVANGISQIPEMTRTVALPALACTNKLIYKEFAALLFERFPVFGGPRVFTGCNDNCSNSLMVIFGERVGNEDEDEDSTTRRWRARRWVITEVHSALKRWRELPVARSFVDGIRTVHVDMELYSTYAGPALGSRMLTVELHKGQRCITISAPVQLSMWQRKWLNEQLEKVERTSVKGVWGAACLDLVSALWSVRANFHGWRFEAGDDALLVAEENRADVVVAELKVDG